jgi:hypothetical protein
MDLDLAIQDGLETCPDRIKLQFGCECCRRIWDLLSDERCRNAVEVVERYAENAASQQAMEQVARIADEVYSTALELGSDGTERWDPSWSQWTSHDSAREYGRFAVRELARGEPIEAARAAARARALAAAFASGYSSNSREQAEVEQRAFDDERKAQLEMLKRASYRDE